MVASAVFQAATTISFLSLFAPRIWQWHSSGRVPVEPMNDRFHEDHYNVPEGKWLEYDFVVVGAGTAGSIVAARLAEVTQWSVLLIEAGPGESYNTTIPATGFSASYGSQYSWNYKSVPQKHAGKGFIGNQIPLPTGKLIGGSALIDDGVVCRGSRAVLDNIWADYGGEEWKFEKTWAAYRASESYVEGPVEEGTESQVERGNGGGIFVTNVRVIDPDDKLVNAFVEIGNEQNLNAKRKDNKPPPNHDYNLQSQTVGFFPAQVMQNGPYRWTPANAFFNKEELALTPNLTILTGGTVTRLLVSLTSGDTQVNGVELYVAEKNLLTYVMARKEVIVATGALNTPKLLMRSGVGPRDELEKVKIDVLEESKGVGKNLRDRVTFYPLTFQIDESVPMKPAFHAYAVNGSGPLAKFAIGQAFYHADEEKSDDKKKNDTELAVKDPEADKLRAITPEDPIEILKKIPQCQITMYNEPPLNVKQLVGHYNYDTQVAEAIGEAEKLFQHGRTFTVGVTLNRPASRGHVGLKNSVVGEPPLVNPNYYSVDEDLVTHAKCVQRAVKFIIQSPAMRALSLKSHVPRVAECDRLYGKQPSNEEIMTRSGRDSEISLDYYKCLVGYVAHSARDFSGTARMGPDDDPDAVVDGRLKLRGVKKVRIVDASVMPEHLGCDIFGAEAMLAEKASEFLFEDWKHTIVTEEQLKANAEASNKDSKSTEAQRKAEEEARKEDERKRKEAAAAEEARKKAEDDDFLAFRDEL